jgi:two-component sensor histidine kinase
MGLASWMQVSPDAVDMTNTPGTLYAISYIISALLYIYINPRRYRDKKIILWQVLLAVILTAFMTVTHLVPTILFLPCVAVDFVIVTAMIGMSCQLNLRNMIYNAMRAFILGEFAASLQWQMFYHAVMYEGLAINIFTQGFFVILVYFLVYCIAYFIEKSMNQESYHMHVEKHEVMAELSMGITVYAVSNLSYLGFSSPFTTTNVQDMFIIRTIVDLAGVGLLMAYHEMLLHSKTLEEKQQIERLLQMQYNNYQVSQESVDLVQQKYHDLKHQIHLLRQEFTTAETAGYLDQMEDEIQAYEADNKTGNQVLDTILTTGNLRCQKLGIEMTCVADGAALNFMSPMDLSSLFGNALDNAIEATEKIIDPQKRLIHISVSREKSFVRIKIENCFDGELKLRGGKPQTTKKDRRYHGFGVKSIEKTVQYYNGSLTIATREGWFELRILIPLAS